MQLRRRVAGRYELSRQSVKFSHAAKLTQAAAAGREVLRVELPGGAWVEIGGGRQVALAAALLRALAPGEGGPC